MIFFNSFDREKMIERADYLSNKFNLEDEIIITSTRLKISYLLKYWPDYHMGYGVEKVVIDFQGYIRYADLFGWSKAGLNEIYVSEK